MKSRIHLSLAAVLIVAGCSQESAPAQNEPVEAAQTPDSAPVQEAASPQQETPSQSAELGDDAGTVIAAPSGDYVLDKAHGNLLFTFDHRGYSRPFVRWGDWDAALSFDAENPTNSSITVTIKTASVDSGVEKFDEHLRSRDFFRAEQHPEITFVSTSAEMITGASGKLTGDLSMRGVTKPVTLDVTLNKAVPDRGGKIGFSARGTIMRSDWGMGRFTPHVPDEIDLIIEAEFEPPGM